MLRFEYQLIVVLFFSLSQIHGSCFYDLPRSSSNETSTNRTSNNKYCQYNSVNYTMNSTWTIGYPECLNCQCSTNAMECCGYGINAGVIDLPDTCKFREGTCDVVLVQKNNPEKLCDEDDDTPKPIQLYRKKKLQMKEIYSKISK